MSQSPIDSRHVLAHVELIGKLLAGAEAEGVIVFSPANILGFTGVPLAPSDRLVCGVVNRGNRAALVCPAFERPAPGEHPPHLTVFTWEEHEDPYRAVAQAVAHLDIRSGIVLLDSVVWIEAERAIRAAMPGLTFREDPGVLGRVRRIKTPAEIEAIAASCRHVGTIYAELVARLQPGRAESELAAEAVAALPHPDCRRAWPLLQSGPNAAVPHRSTGARRLAAGDCVIADFYLPVQGYWGDMTRTLCVGRPSDKARRAYEAVRRAQRAAIAACKPGVPCEEIDRTARAVIEAEGFGPYFVHRLGHGIGLDCHEPPYLVRGNAQPLEPGVCVTIEPGVYVPGEFGIRIEDVVAITSDGCRNLSDGVPTDLSPGFAD